VKAVGASKYAAAHNENLPMSSSWNQMNPGRITLPCGSNPHICGNIAGEIMLNHQLSIVNFWYPAFVGACLIIVFDLWEEIKAPITSVFPGQITTN
jgi:hypothetical protein